QQLAAARMLQVQGHRPLVLVQHRERQGGVPLRQGAPAQRLALGRLDLDDVGAGLGHQQGRVRALKDLAEIDDGNPGKREGHGPAPSAPNSAPRRRTGASRPEAGGLDRGFTNPYPLPPNRGGKVHRTRRNPGLSPIVRVAALFAVLAALTLAARDFAALPGWSDDHVGAALPAFLKSCARLANAPATAPVDPEAHGADFGRVGDWRPLCRQALAVPAGNDAAVRRFFEANFVPALAGDRGNSVGLFTGYYEAELTAS